MTIWQVDLQRLPSSDRAGRPLWELRVCEAQGNWCDRQRCAQPDLTVAWLQGQLAAWQVNHDPPQKLQVFRPQCLSLIQQAAAADALTVEPCRQPLALQRWLYSLRAEFSGDFDPLAIEKSPPEPLPERLLGERWRFASLSAAELELAFVGRPIPVQDISPHRLPLQLGLASHQLIPGVVIDGGRQAMVLARWLAQRQPAFLSYVAGAPDGLILDAGLGDRWVLFTFEDPEVQAAALRFQQAQQAAQGLHFLVVRPDDSGMTTSGVWLLQTDEGGYKTGPG
jgi:hypothetical protein